MGCNRKGCNNVMCDKYSTTFGYICYECYYEGIGQDLSVLEFMKTDKNTFKQTRETEFEHYFVEGN